jgi:hypothetical protein
MVAVNTVSIRIGKRRRAKIDAIIPPARTVAEKPSVRNDSTRRPSAPATTVGAQPDGWAGHVVLEIDERRSREREPKTKWMDMTRRRVFE